MSDDAKADFYLKHWVRIEEWAALRAPVVDALETALFAGAARLAQDASLPAVATKSGSWSNLQLPITADPLARIELFWKREGLLRGAGGWPEVAIVMDSKASKDLKRAVADATAFAGESLGLVRTMATVWWVRSGPVVPTQEPIAIESYALQCIEHLEATWRATNEAVRAAVGRHPAT
ncbi:hypothetical protein [Nocardioides ultimimeridianus]